MLRKINPNKSDDHVGNSDEECNLTSDCKWRHLHRKGAYGSSVYLCGKKFGGKPCAVKKMSVSIYPNIKEEVSMILRTEDDKHVINYKHSQPGEETISITMELCGGDLEQFVWCKIYQRESKEEKYDEIKPINQEERGYRSEQFLEYFDINTTNVMLQAVKGIKYLHSYKVGPKDGPIDSIVHGDIKPSNFLLYKHKVYGTLVKVADYGFSRAFHCETITAGTPSFMAPEYCVEPGKKPGLTTKADIFCLGLTLFYIFTEGSHVYGKHPYERLYEIWRSENQKFNEALPRGQVTGTGMDKLTDEHRITFCDMIRRMLKFDPSQRFNIYDVAKHPTFWKSKKKVEFYWEVHNTLKEHEDLSGRIKLDLYEKNLLEDDQKGEEKVRITLQNIPQVCRFEPEKSQEGKSKKKGKKGKSEKKQINFNEDKPVAELLRVMRNKKSHKDLTKEEKDLLFEKDNKGKYRDVDFDAFLREFTGKFPQLLVHIYEKFRDRDELYEKDEFYPEVESC